MPVSLPPPFSRPIFGAHAVFPPGGRGLTSPPPLSSTSAAAKTLCSFCGQENDAAAQFCADCGKSLRASRAVPTQTPPGMQAVTATASGTAKKCRKCNYDLEANEPY